MKTFFRKFDDTVSQALTSRFCAAIAKECNLEPGIAKAIPDSDFHFLATADMAYRRSDSLSDIIGARQILGFYSKNADINLDIDKKKVAFDKFLQSEETCSAINRKFRRSDRGGLIDHYVESVLLTAQRKIAQILGPLPSMEMLRFSYGPGANVDVKKNTSARWKLSSSPTCSANMAGIISDVLAELPQISSFWSDHESNESWSVSVRLVPGRLMFVPKNAKTDRTIIAEPSLNTLVQKGIGSYMKHRLRFAGVDLYDQSESLNSNRQRARMASITNDLMTVDLSSASDTIAKLLVMELLPYEWYEFLSSIRTSHVECTDYQFSTELQKFSSMGNGFTFELESLIFFALTWAVCVHEEAPLDVTVYGDDIIAPSSIFEQLGRVFSYVGFKINDEKSFVSGPFRESCGGDYFLGQDVRPYYQKSNWSMADLFSFHNFMIRKGLNFLFPFLYEEVQNSIPTSIRLYGPDGFGDGHLIGDHRRVPFRFDYGWGGYTFSTYTQRTKRLLFGLLPGDFLLPVYLASVGSDGTSRFSVRGSTGVCKKIRIYTLG